MRTNDEELYLLIKKLKKEIEGLSIQEFTTINTLANSEGPGIDITAAGAIGLGGDTILLYDSGGAPVAEYAATKAGLTSALGAATSGDWVIIPAVTIDCDDTAYTVPAGVTLTGIDKDRSVLSFQTTADLAYTVFTLGASGYSKAAILNMTINLDANGPANYRVFRSYGGIVKHANVNVTCLEGKDGGSIEVFYGIPYGADYQAFCAIEDVDVNIRSVLAVAPGLFQAFDIFESAASNQRSYVIRGVNVSLTFANADNASADFRLWETDIYTAANGSIYILENCNVYVNAALTLIDADPISIGGEAFYLDNTIAKSCTVRMDINATDNEAYDLWGFNTYITRLIDCNVEMTCVAVSTGDDESMVGYYLNGDCALLGCRANVTNTGTEGTTAIRAYNGDCYIIDGQYVASEYSIYNDAADSVNIYGAQLDTGLFGGDPIVYLPGDRRSLNVPSTQTTAYTISQDNEIVLGDASGGAFSVTLPAVAGCKGWKETIKKIDSSANAVTVDGDGAETIDDAATVTLDNQYDAIQIVCDGTEWWIV